MELPIEVEIELSPAGSLKQAPLWKEQYQLLKNPYAIACPPDNPATPLDDESNYCTATIPRRPGFGAAMPPLKVYSPKYNFLTAQPMRLRTSDGEVSWDQPGPLFNPAQNVALDAFNTPTLLRTPIGHLVACPNVDNPATLFVNEAYQAAAVPANFCNGKPNGSLVVLRNQGTPGNLLPATGTVVAVSAVNSVGQLVEEDGTPITELETPINEEDFFRPTTDVAAPNPLPAPYIGRFAAEVLGKALFWDMQVGSDGVQSCGTCHFNAGVDNRTKGQLNPNLTASPLGPTSTTLEVKPPNTDVVANDFPFHKAAHDVLGGAFDKDDTMSSMGVSRFKQFVDIPPIGGLDVPATAAIEGSFGPASAIGGVRPLAPDRGTLVPDLVPVNQGLRRVEPRNTPTFHGAAFNFDNFWDGRARSIFNGGSVFGPSDPTAHIFFSPAAPALIAATNGTVRPDLDPEIASQPVRIKFSSLASQSVGPPLSDFEMSFAGRNWAKIGKRMLQAGVTPLANQLVATTDSRLGPFSNQGGSVCGTLVRPVAAGKPGLCVTYPELIQAAFAREFWRNTTRHLNGAPGPDPFDGYVLALASGPAQAANTNQFTQMEANFSLLFGLSVQAYEQLTIPDDTPADRFFDVNPFAGHGVGEPGDQAVLFPTLIKDLLDDGLLNGTNTGTVTLIPDDLATPFYDGFGPDELFGFDLFAGANLTAALTGAQAVDPISLRNRNPLVTNSVGQSIRVGSNPFTRSAKCMLCHLGPEQTDHSVNISHGLLKNDAEFEYPVPPRVADPTRPCTFGASDCFLPAPEPSGSSRAVVGLILAEEVGEGVAQDAVEVEPRNLATFDDPATPWDDRIIAQESNFAFGDQGVYNIGLRPIAEDIGRGGDDPFGWPLSLAALTLKNIGGQAFEPCDGPTDSCVMANFDPNDIGATFEVTGADQRINPGFERDPINPQMPEYMAPWINSLPAGELHPQIDEMAGMVPNTISAPNGGPGIEFPEILFGADLHCASYNPATFGFGPPNFGWGPPTSTARVCPQIQSGVAGNFAFPSQGTWPVPNRVLRDGAFKAPPLRNVELTGPFFHTGSYLTLRQVVDFYFRGGDFPDTNKESRDPHVVDLENQAFAFGPTKGTFGGFDLLTPFDCSAAAPNDPLLPVVSCGPTFNYLAGSFGDGLPDTVFLYDQYPDSDHLITPEPAFASRAVAIEDAKNSLVKFMLALTDPRVKLEKAPFDRPEIFVPIDGRAPENTDGRDGGAAVATSYSLIGQSGGACTLPLARGVAFLPEGPNPGPVCFKQVPAVGTGGRPAFNPADPLNTGPLSAFLEMTTIPPGGTGFNCNSSTGPVSHFCSAVF